VSGYQLGTGSNWIYHMLLILPWHMSIDTEQMGNPSPILIPPVASCFHTRRRTSSRPVTQSVSPSRCQATLSTMAPHLSKKTLSSCTLLSSNVFSLASHSQSSFSGQPASLTITQMVATDFPVLPH